MERVPISKALATICCCLLVALTGGLGEPPLKLSTDFPSLDDTVEMAALSLVVYAFRDELDDSRVCEMVRLKNYTDVPEEILQHTDIECHFYYHSRVQGTQVMIVSSKSKRYNAVVFAGTDDTRTALTDADSK